MSLELYHYGVKGMKWGVRRENKKYNQDGFLTSEGHKQEIKRRKKLSNEQSDNELRKIYNSRKSITRHRLSDETKRFVADGYSTVGHSKNMKKAMKEYRKSIKDGKEQYEKCKQKIDRLVLKELGYADTETGRTIIRDFWDKGFF